MQNLNIFLVLGAFVCLGVLGIIYFAPKSTGPQHRLARASGIGLLVLGFLACTLPLVRDFATQGHFSGLLGGEPVPGLIAAACWLGLMLLLLWLLNLLGERRILGSVLVLLPVVVALGFFWFWVRSEPSNGWTPTFFQLKYGVGLAVALLAALWFLAGAIPTSADRRAHSTWRIRPADIPPLQFVLDHRPDDGLPPLLPHTGHGSDPAVRQLAVSKIKEYPDWEGELLHLLETDEYRGLVFIFLDIHPVEHPERFSETIERSLRQMAVCIRVYIEDSRCFVEPQALKDAFAVDQALRVVKNPVFQYTGVDYAPAIHEVRTALDLMRRAPETN